MGDGRVSHWRGKGNDGWLERADDRGKSRAAIGIEELATDGWGWRVDRKGEQLVSRRRRELTGREVEDEG